MEQIKKSLLAGMCVAIGASTILIIPNSYVSSFTFSVGLLMVSVLGLNMFTGKCGNWCIHHNSSELFSMLFFNMVGLFFISVLLKFTRLYDTITAKATEINMVNESDSMLSVFLLACMCGMCLVLAVESYKRNNVFGMILVIFVFSQCCYQHSLANSYFIFVSGNDFKKDIVIILLEVLGNFLGSNFLTMLLHNKENKSV